MYKVIAYELSKFITGIEQKIQGSYVHVKGDMMAYTADRKKRAYCQLEQGGKIQDIRLVDTAKQGEPEYPSIYRPIDVSIQLDYESIITKLSCTSPSRPDQDHANIDELSFPLNPRFIRMDIGALIKLCELDHKFHYESWWYQRFLNEEEFRKLINE